MEAQHERQFKVIGTRPIRHDGVDKVTGRACYGADITLPGPPARESAAQSTSPRADQINQDLRSASPARRQSGHYRSGLSGD